MLGYPNNLYSVIDTRVDINTALMSILDKYDSNTNQRPKLLDTTSFLNWSMYDDNMYNIDKTRNLSGYVKDKSYGIIIYECSKNSKYLTDAKRASLLFRTQLLSGGILIVKSNDFRMRGRLKGTFEVKEVFEKAGFYLTDNIIYRHNNNRHFENDAPAYQHSEIVHSNFLVFKV